jgi:hypothetical protein
MVKINPSLRSGDLLPQRHKEHKGKYNGLILCELSVFVVNSNIISYTIKTK